MASCNSASLNEGCVSGTFLALLSTKFDIPLHVVFILVYHTNIVAVDILKMGGKYEVLHFVIAVIPIQFGFLCFFSYKSYEKAMQAKVAI